MTSRRDFLKGVAAAGTLSGLASKSEAQAAQAETQTRAAVSALPPSSYVEAMESDIPGYSEDEADSDLSSNLHNTLNCGS